MTTSTECAEQLGGDDATEHGMGMSMLVSRLVNEYQRLGGRVVVYDKGSSYERLVGSMKAESGGATAGGTDAPPCYNRFEKLE